MTNPEKVAAVLAITQLFKYYGLRSKHCPLVAIAVGVLLEYSDNPTSDGVLRGVILGATVTGSYGVVKGSAQSVMEPFKPKKAEPFAFIPPVPVRRKSPPVFEQSFVDLEHDEDRFV